MARVKRAMMTRKRRKKVLKLAKGYFGGKSKLFRTAKEAVMKSGQYAYIGRRQKKRDFRRLWITRISAGCRANGKWALRGESAGGAVLKGGRMVPVCRLGNGCGFWRTGRQHGSSGAVRGADRVGLRRNRRGLSAAAAGLL